MPIKSKQREVKMTWEELSKLVRFGEEEELKEITLMKPKQVLFRLSRKEKVDHVSKQTVS